MSGLGELFTGFQAGAGGQVTSVDIDRYGIYQIIGPMMGTFAFGTTEGTNAQAKSIVWAGQVAPDYPRNLEMKILPASGSITGGTFTVTGKNQFGESQSETFAVGTAVNGGTAVGTKVWAYFSTTSGTIGTGDPGVGTVTFYPASTGTTALFGLPTKIASTADVKLMTYGSTGVAKPVNKGTIGAFVDVATHSIKAPDTITTPAANATWISVWYKTTYRNEFKTPIAGL